jgi:SAM-dependent methyltransferase
MKRDTAQPTVNPLADSSAHHNTPAFAQRRRVLASMAKCSIAPAALTVMAPAALAQNAPAPVLGTPGKDAGWIPTPAPMVEGMLRMAGVSKNDLVVDLGSGDGRIPIFAAKAFGARGLGIELNRDLVAYSDESAKKEGVADRVRFVNGDIFEVDFSQGTVLSLFMPPQVNARLLPKILAMRPGTRVVSYVFAMADWEPDDWVFFDAVQGMLWVVPARFDGRWRIETQGPGADTYEVRLTQRYQKVDGRFLFGTAPLPLFDANVLGDRLRFTVLVGERRFDFEGYNKGGAVEGTLHVTGEPRRTFRATRL